MKLRRSGGTFRYELGAFWPSGTSWGPFLLPRERAANQVTNRADYVLRGGGVPKKSEKDLISCVTNESFTYSDVL